MSDRLNSEEWQQVLAKQATSKIMNDTPIQGTQEQWDTWWDGRFTAAFGPRIEDLCDGLGTETGKMERRLREEIAVLREEIAQLRAVQSGTTSGKIYPMKQVPDFLLRGSKG